MAALGLADGTVHVAMTGDAAPGEPARPGDTMRIGSITKTFMAALTLRLDDLGVLDIDDPVAAHLPDLGIDDTVIIRDLLAHTSGIADPDPAEIIARFREDSGQRFEYRDLIAFADIPTNSDPRSGEFAYANASYHVLGGVIEAATGTDVAIALRSHVLDPAGLKQTHLAGAEPVPTPIVPGNVDLDGDGHEDTLAGVPYLAVETHAWAAGALVSTADDIIRFARALFAGTIISDHALAEMTNTSTAEHGHGLGIFDLGVDGQDRVRQQRRRARLPRQLRLPPDPRHDRGRVHQLPVLRAWWQRHMATLGRPPRHRRRERCVNSPTEHFRSPLRFGSPNNLGRRTGPGADRHQRPQDPIDIVRQPRPFLARWYRQPGSVDRRSELARLTARHPITRGAAGRRIGDMKLASTFCREARSVSPPHR